MKEELKVLFYLKKNQVNASGLCSVMGRITIGQSMAQFSAKIEAEPSKWDAKAGRMNGKSNHALQVNRQIDKINLSINARYKEYLTNRGSVTAEELKNAFQGIATTQETLLKVFAEHNEVYGKRVGIDRVKRTYKGYCNAYSHLADFLRKKYHVRDMSFNQLTFSFIEAYDFYLRVDLKMKPNTILGYIIPFRKVVRIALNKGFITRDPFTEYKPERGRSEHRTLTSEELQKIMNATFDSPNRTLIRDLFVFSSFCGLAFADIRRLTENELVTTEDGKQWIVMARKKTGTISRIRLLDIPLQIIEKYKKDRVCEKIFSVPGYSTVDINLKRIAEICDINKSLTYHQSRHTFASVVCLSQGVPIETVSRMLGHKDIHTTQIYATVSTQKISDDMKQLSERMAGKFSFVKSKKNNNNMRSTFKYLFYINRNKVKKNGLCPVMGRVTLDGEIAQFSTGLETNPDLWDAKTGRSTGRTTYEAGVNRELRSLSASIEKHYASIVEKDGYVTAERVKNAVMNIAQEPTTLLKELDEATEEIRKSIGINHTIATYRSYVNTHLNLSRFIRDKYGKSDMPFSSLEYSFIEDYDMYLKIDHKMATGSVVQHIIFLRKLIKRAMNKGIISRNPFFGYIPDQPKTSRKWLSCEEIEKVMTTTIEHPSVAFVRDMFVFGCWTGLSYTDIKKLQDINIVTDSEGSQWIDIKRQKTGSRSLIPLLDIPKEIIKKYKGTGEKGKVFKMLCMNVVCQYTKRIGKLCGLAQKLTFHQSRHSFGTSICLTQGVPIETLSQMMGHRNIKTTQIYAEITGAKIEEDMQRLSQKIEDKFQLIKT